MANNLAKRIEAFKRVHDADVACRMTDKEAFALAMASVAEQIDGAVLESGDGLPRLMQGEALFAVEDLAGGTLRAAVTFTAADRSGHGWGTDAALFSAVVAQFERALPGFWWSVGQCSVGAHASCAVDGNGCQAYLLDGVQAGEPLDAGFHCDTDGGSPAEALRDVMNQALAYLKDHAPDAGGHPKAQKESAR